MLGRLMTTLVTVTVLISCGKDNPVEDNPDPVDSLKVGLLAHYPFNGNANDESGNNYHLTVRDATSAPDRFGIASKAYFFNGSAFMTMPKLLKADGKAGSTVSLWFKATKDSISTDVFLNFLSNRADQACSSTFLLYKTPSGYDLHSAYFMEETTLSCSVAINNNGVPDPTGTWQHVVFVQRPIQSALRPFQHYHYLNGNALINKSGSRFNPISTSFVYGGQVAAQESGGAQFNYFNGSIDDIRIYDRALSENEIQKLYTLDR
jgi:hypothetical protein